MGPKEWLSRAIIRMIIEDKQLHQQEINRLTQTMKNLNINADLEYITNLVTLNSKEPIEFLKLEPLLNIEPDVRYKMLIELAKTAALDNEIVQCEEDRFVKMSSLLGFSPTFARQVIGWARKYIEVALEENKLCQRARKDIQSSKS